MLELSDIKRAHDFLYGDGQIVPLAFLERLRREWNQFTERLHVNRNHSKLNFTYYSAIDNYHNTELQYLKAQKLIKDTNKRIEDSFEMIKSIGLFNEKGSRKEIERIREINTVIEEDGEDTDGKDESQKDNISKECLIQEQFHYESEESLTVRDYQEQEIRLLFDSDLDIVEVQDNPKNQWNYHKHERNIETDEQQCSLENVGDDKTVQKQKNKKNRQFASESHKLTVKNINQEQRYQEIGEELIMQNKQGIRWQNKCEINGYKKSNENQYSLLLSCRRNLNEELIQQREDYQEHYRYSLSQSDAVEQLNYVGEADQVFEDIISSTMPVCDENSFSDHEKADKQQLRFDADYESNFNPNLSEVDGLSEEEYSDKSQESSQQQELSQEENDIYQNDEQQITEKMEFLCSLGPENITITLGDYSSKKQLSNFKKAITRLLSQL